MGAANMSAGLLSDIHAGTVYGWIEWIGCKADRVNDGERGRRVQVSREYSSEMLHSVRSWQQLCCGRSIMFTSDTDRRAEVKE